MKFKEFKHEPVQPDTYEASMALNQLMRIGKHAIKLHNMIDDAAEMESWVAKKIDLAGDYVKKVYNYTEGEKAGLYDDGGMTEDKGSTMASRVIRNYAREIGADSMDYDMFIKSANLLDKDMLKSLAQHIDNSDTAPREYVMKKIADHDPETFRTMYGDQEGYLSIMKPQKDLTDDESVSEDAGEKIANMAQNMTKDEFMSNADELGLTPKEAAEYYEKMQGGAYAGKFEDAGEGHMSKSTLYHTAKYAIELMQMIKKGDDLEGWVQSKLNKAADYLQGVYNYEEYQKLNPYREELDSNILQKHAQVVQKNIDEILARETKLDDIDTKPGMMRILAKRVNEVEKEIAKETRKKSGVKEDGHVDIPSAIRNCETIIEDAMQMKQKLETMQGELPSWMTQMIAVAASDLNAARDYLLNPTSESGIMYRAGVKKYGKKGMTAIQSAAGKGASHQEIGKIKDKYIKDDEHIDEGLKDFVKKLAMAGVIVAGLAGVSSINDAIDNSVPAVKAMNSALEMAKDSGNDELAKMIEKDLSAVKVRLSSGKDLNFVKDMQDKYIKFMPTEGIAYESRLAIQLNQQLK